MIVSYSVILLFLVVFAITCILAAAWRIALSNTIKTNNGLYKCIQEDGEMMVEIHAKLEGMAVKLDNKNARLVKASQYISASPVIPQEEKLMVVGILADQTLSERIQDKIEEVKNDSTNTRR